MPRQHPPSLWPPWRRARRAPHRSRHACHRLRRVPSRRRRLPRRQYRRFHRHDDQDSGHHVHRRFLRARARLSDPQGRRLHHRWKHEHAKRAKKLHQHLGRLHQHRPGRHAHLRRPGRRRRPCRTPWPPRQEQQRSRSERRQLAPCRHRHDLVSHARHPQHLAPQHQRQRPRCWTHQLRPRPHPRGVPLSPRPQTSCCAQRPEARPPCPGRPEDATFYVTHTPRHGDDRCRQRGPPA